MASAFFLGLNLIAVCAVPALAGISLQDPSTSAAMRTKWAGVVEEEPATTGGKIRLSEASASDALRRSWAGIAAEMDEVFEAGSFTATHLASQQESAAAKASVDATTAHWMDVVTAPGDTSDEVSGLYAADAVFWGSVSEGVRVGREAIQDYFDYFANIPGLRVKPGSFQSHVQIMGDFAISSGYYTFQFPNDRGGMNTIPARFTFYYRRTAEGGWEIVNHHSSQVIFSFSSR